MPPGHLDLYYCLFVKYQNLFISVLYSPLCDRLSLQVKDDWAVPWIPCFVMKSLMKLFIMERMSVHLQFDISDIGQPFPQRCSELATEGLSGILTEPLMKAVGHSLAAELGGHPKCLMYFVV